MSASSPALALMDLEMAGPADTHFDEYDFFTEQLSPGVFGLSSPGTFDDSMLTNPSPYHIGSPSSAKEDITISPFSRDIETASPKPALSPQSSASPAGSYRDSSSESSGYKRKSSTDSSRSVMMAEDTDMRDWKPASVVEMQHYDPYGAADSSNATIDPARMDLNYDFNDKAMEKDFDFESAASSPSPFNMSQEVEPPSMPSIKQDAVKKRCSGTRVRPKSQNRTASSSRAQPTKGVQTSTSREASPLSAMVTSKDFSSPAAFRSCQSPNVPNVGIEFIHGQMPNPNVPNHAWHPVPEYAASGLRAPKVEMNAVPLMKMPYHSMPSMAPTLQPPRLTVHPTPQKSRVETQIPIKVTLFPVPSGITKLHLPTHTISKPKLLNKPAHRRSPDTLELQTTLVCTSAMQNPELRRLALQRAAGPDILRAGSPSAGLDDAEENRPLNGGEVRICSGCVIREQKRAARKKVKKVEEEESWHKDEHKRVIVFNTNEVKEWSTPTTQTQPDGVGDRPEPFVPEGALQVDIPMRIACYCRHQNEKVGFQVIFTLKDYQDRLIAQTMSSSIMITDDHKTHNVPGLPIQISSGSEDALFSAPVTYSSDRGVSVPTAPAEGLNPFRLSQSSSDLQNLSQGHPVQYQPPMNFAASSQTNSAAPTPRHVSPQATSPSASGGPLSKKRKASGSAKVPTGLAMTKLETAQPSRIHSPAATTPMNPTTSNLTSPFSPIHGMFSPGNDHMFSQQHGNIPGAGMMAYQAGPQSPPNSNDQGFVSSGVRSQSMENLSLQQLYSAPPSAHPSRAPSPNGVRNNMQAQAYHQHQMAQAVHSGLYGMPLSLSPQRPPTIHKLIPSEGPKAGGIEVTCLGSGFCQGLEVMFGESKATTTTYWGETSLVCLLPPAAFAGTVAVTFKHHHQQIQVYPTPPMPKQHATFKYIDDDEQQIIRTALSVLGHKMTGKMEDVRDLARRIVGDGPSTWVPPSSQSPSGGTQTHPGSSFSAATFGVDVEATLLRCLDLIDLDDSPNLPRFNLRRASGQTMLHLACSLGLHRFVAALLARGANPEPKDKGGFTPMHFAALHNHPQIVRRLMLGGADPGIRSVRGYTAANMTASEEVIRATRRVEHHSRSRSGSSLRSRTSSATSLRSLWEPLTESDAVDVPAFGVDSEDEDNEYENEDADAAVDGVFWMKSRRPSAQMSITEPVEDAEDTVLELPNIGPFGGLASPAASVIAFRDSLAAQIQQFQQIVHVSLPNLPQMNLPNLPHMPTLANLPDYQAYLEKTPMVKRISNLVNHNRPEPTYKWWDLISGTIPAAPPAYEDIFPEGDLDSKRSSAAQAAADAVADDKCAELFDQSESSTQAQQRPMVLDTVRIGQKHVITREQQDKLRSAHAEKVKKLRYDRNLFLIWIPTLLILIIAMLINRVPQLWQRWEQVANYFETSRLVAVE